MVVVDVVVVVIVFAVLVGMTPIAGNTSTKIMIDGEIAAVVADVVVDVVVVVDIALMVNKAFAEADRVKFGDEITENPPSCLQYGSVGP